MTDQGPDRPAGITEEMLMAYADDALAPDERARVERAVADHPELAEEIESYRLSRAALADAFDQPLNEPVPEHLRALVMKGPRGSEEQQGSEVASLAEHRARRAWYAGPWGQAIAAVFVFGFGALFGGLLMPQPAPSDGSGDLMLAARLPVAHPVAQALETAGSAETVALKGGEFHAVLTFTDASGGFCREFETRAEAGAAVGIACRRDDAWAVELLLAAEPRPDGQGGFQLASGFDEAALDTVLDRLGASAGFDRETEQCLIARDWPQDGGCIE